MPIIMSSNGKPILVDEEVFGWASKLGWHVRGDGYVSGRVMGRKVLLHRAILDAPTGLEVDHINQDRLDNRRSNLRLCTRSQNIANRGAMCRSKFGVKGVWQQRGDVNFFRAQVMKDGVRYFNSFHALEDARAWVTAKRVELFGEFACHD